MCMNLIMKIWELVFVCNHLAQVQNDNCTTGVLSSSGGLGLVGLF